MMGTFRKSSPFYWLQNWLVGLTGWSALFLIIGFMTAHAQQGKCLPMEVLSEQLADPQFQETPLFRGVVSEKVLVHVWFSGVTRTWTIFIERADGIACLIASGKDGDIPEVPTELGNPGRDAWNPGL